jgi:hypothetical protein
MASNNAVAFLMPHGPTATITFRSNAADFKCLERVTSSWLPWTVSIRGAVAISVAWADSQRLDRRREVRIAARTKVSALNRTAVAQDPPSSWSSQRPRTLVVDRSARS